MKKISSDKYHNIIFYLKKGFSIRNVADICGVSKSKVQEIKAENPSLAHSSSSGRKSKLSPQLK